MIEWFRPAGSSPDPQWDVKITPGDPGWQHTGLYAVTLAPGESRTVETGDCEWIVLPLSGGAVVEVDGERLELAGRPVVFAGPTDLAYVPRDSSFVVTSPAGGRIALPFARAATAQPVCRVPASAVPVELRGAGSCSRQVNNFGTPGVLQADSIIACEVITPAGNWSSYPPHKHDEDRPGCESALEEIYYLELRPAGGGVGARDAVAYAGAHPGVHSVPGHPGANRVGGDDHGADPVVGDSLAHRVGGEADPIGYLRNYGTTDRPIDTLQEVRSGDVVLIPHGWHGPAMAPPGYDMYYLNVMAGPGAERAWVICDDPAHAWVRSTWPDQPVDPRLPMRG